MNSIKSGLTVLFLLGMSYGVYTLVNTPESSLNQLGQNLPGEPEKMLADSFSESAPPRAFEQHQEHNLMPSSPANQPQGFRIDPLPKIDSNIASNGAPKLIESKPEKKSAVWEIPKSLSEEKTTPPAATPPAAMPTGNQSNLVEVKPPPQKKFDFGPSGNQLAKTPATDSPVAVKPDTAPIEAKTAAVPKQRVRPPAVVLTDADLDGVWPKIDQWVSQGKLREPLAELSRFYHGNLSGQKRTELVEWLDALAFKVVYSTEHHLTQRPYIAQAGDTLDSVARKWNVPVSLVFNVNRDKIGDTKKLTPGIELKAIPGPFRAEIDISRKEMTLFLDKLYAGRFPVQIGNDSSLGPGEFQVQTVSYEGQAYQGAMGQSYEPGHPNNPYGRYWMDLGGKVCIHSTASQKFNERMGCISLREADAQDVFGILSKNSQIEILR